MPSVRAELKRIDLEMPLANIRTMHEYMAQSLMPRRAAMLLTVCFGVLSLFLSAIGIYGVLAYLVTQRSREIGIRIALGSTNRGIFKLIVPEGLLLVSCGLALGLAGVAALRRVLQSQLYGLGSMDPPLKNRRTLGPKIGAAPSSRPRTRPASRTTERLGLLRYVGIAGWSRI